MILTTQKQTDQQLSAEEFRTLGNHNRPAISADSIGKYRGFVASWLKFRRKANLQRLSANRLERWFDNGSKRRKTSKVGAEVCWLILADGEISAPNGGQMLLEGVTTRDMPRRLISAPAGFVGAPSRPNEKRKCEPTYARYLYHTDKSSRKIRVAKRESGIAIKIRETEREILQRRAELEIVLPYFATAKEHRAAKRRGSPHDAKLAALCERMPPSPIVSREVREGDRIDDNAEQPDLSRTATRLLNLLQKKCGQRNGHLVFDSLQCGLSVRQSADGICAESSLRRWIATVAR